VIESPADYEAITRTAPFLTELSLKLPGSTTALPQQMDSLLSAASKLEDLTLNAYEEVMGGSSGRFELRESSLVDVDAFLAAGTQLLHLRLPHLRRLRSLTPLRALVNLQSLDISVTISEFSSVSDLAPLAALLNLQSLDIGFCSSVSDLVPLAPLVNLQSLDKLLQVSI
jgi:hypothetical protein